MKMHFSKGGVLIVMLVMLAMFTVIAIATSTYIDRQYILTINQEQEERSFHLAEAGVHYTLFLLNDGIYTTQELVDMETFTDTVTKSGQDIGRFDLFFSSLGSPGEGVIVTAEGRDTSLDICQAVTATVQRSGIGYFVASWDHGVGCEDRSGGGLPGI